MPILLQDKGRDYRRLRHTPQEKAQLSRAGFQHVLSSNVSAVAVDGNALVIRFHGGATYKYFNKGDMFDSMMQSNSKGRFVWQKLIRTKARYQKVGSVTFKDDAQFSDRDLMEVSKKPTKKPMLDSIVAQQSLIELGIIANPNIIDSIIATNAIS